MSVSFQFDWDPVKAAANAAANIAKHGVSFEDAMTVFNDPLALTIPDPQPVGAEERWITIGMARPPLIVLVVHTHIEIDVDTVYIRIISARKPTRGGKRQYENG